MSSLKHRKSSFAIILIFAFLFCAAAITFIVNELVQNQTYYTRSFGKEQELLVEQISIRCKDTLIESTGTDKDVIEKILMTAETSGSRYWFLVKEDELIFYKNAFEMEQLKIKKFDELIYSYKTADGHNIDELSTLINSKTNGTVLFSKSKSEKKILTSISFFQVSNTKYLIGMCTTENYISSSGKLMKHNTYSIIVIVTLCLVLISIIIGGLLIINEKDDKILISEKTIRSKNIKIDALTQVGSKPEYMYNKETQLYGKEVLYALLKKSNKTELFPFSILVIKLVCSDNLAYDDLVLELAPELHEILPKNSVATRLDENQLVILFMKTKYSKVKYYEEKLLKAWSSILKALKSSVQTDVVTQFIGQEAPIDMFEYWVHHIVQEREEI